MTRPDLHLRTSRPRRATSARPLRSGVCVLCGTYRLTLHRDHIVPIWRGGPDEPSNEQYICANCHEDKNRADMLGYRHAPEIIARIADAARGRVTPPEVRAKIAAALRGRRPSPLTRLRMSQSQTARWKERRWA